MKLIKTLDKGAYVNIEYIQYVYSVPHSGKFTYYISVGVNRNSEISEETYNSLIRNYYE